MSRLDQEHDVVALARELGLRGDPVEAVVRFCEEKIGCWAEDVGGVETVAALEQLVADHLQLVFEEVCSDDDLEQNHRQVRGPGRVRVRHVARRAWSRRPSASRSSGSIAGRSQATSTSP